MNTHFSRASVRTGWRTVLGLAVTALACGVAISGQDARPQQPVRDAGVGLAVGTAAISGQIALDDGRPVRQATVNISGAQLRGSRMTVTDDAGRFLFADLPAGQFSLSASKPAHISLTYNPTAPGTRSQGPPLQLTAGQRIAVTMRMARGAVISGRILDDSGRPLSGVRPQAVQFRMQGGQRTSMTMRSAPIPTDDRGMYRIFGLPAGEYVISAIAPGNSNAPLVTQAEIDWARTQATMTAATSSPGSPGSAGARAPATTPPPPGPPVGFAPVYFPGTTEPSRAMVLTIAEGEERNGVDFSMRAVPLSKVEGVVFDPAGQPAQSIQVMLTQAATGEIGPQGMNVSTRVDRDGKFAVMNVPPGQYLLVVRSTIRPPGPPPVPGGPMDMPPQPMASLWAMTDVSVNGQDLFGLSLTLAPGLKVSGQIVIEATGAPPADLTRARVQISAVQSMPFGGGNQSVTTADGRFVVSGVMPGRYRLGGSLPPSPGQTGGWMLKSVVRDGRDLLDAPPIEIAREDLSGLVVTFTDRLTELSGTLVTSAGQPAASVYVLVFSTNRAHWTQATRRQRSVRSGPDGKFRFGSLVPGEYYMITMADLTNVDWTDPAFLEQLAAAAFTITFAEGEKKVQDLKMAK